jgi:diguanylate cyclase (GGDEF)-like protein
VELTLEPGGGQRLDSAFLDRFNYLQKTGALDDLSSLRKENRELDALINDAASLFALTTIEEMFAFVISRLLERFIPTHLSFLIEPPRGGELKQYRYLNLKPVVERLPDECYFALRDFFLASPYPIGFEDLKEKLGAGTIHSQLASEDPEIIYPMTGIEGLYGIAVLGRKIVGEPYSELERMYVDKVTRFLAIGIQNSLHHESAITDAKTGLYNHSHFMQRLEQEIARVTRHKARAGILMLDIDHFKRFNDTWGHLAGDEVLNKLALTLKRTVRSEDIAARFGGEEFCVLAIECDREMLLSVSERVRSSIETMVVEYKGQCLSVTASIGCCLLDPSRHYVSAEYLEMADKALYTSKTAGRNRVTFYKPGLLDRAQAIRKLRAI